MRGIRLNVSNRSIGALMSVLLLACVSSHPATQPPAQPRISYVDQRAAGGFRLPSRPPKPRKPIKLSPSLLGSMSRTIGSTPIPPPSAPLAPPRAGCGFVQAGTTRIPLDCARPGYGVVNSAAHSLARNGG